MAAPMQVRVVRNFCHLCKNITKMRLKNPSVRYISSRNETEYSDEPEYPPIKPRYPQGSKWGSLPEEFAWEWYDEGMRLREIPDVRERLEEIAKKEYKMWQILPFTPWPRMLDYQQYITKTHLIQGLPNIYSDIDVDTELELVKPLLLNNILLHNCRQWDEVKAPDRIKDSNLVASYVQSLMAVLAPKYEYLQKAQLGQDVRVETFWRCHGFDPKKYVRGQNKHGHVMLQGRDRASFQIRTDLPLPEVLESDDKIITSGEVPEFPYQPSTVAQSHAMLRPITVSGHWIADPCEFALVSIYSSPPRLERLKNLISSPSELSESLLGAGIISSFVSAVSQAHNQGFNMYDDITYPLTTQSIYTDGQNFQFFTYQLNTMHTWREREEHLTRNICWASEEMSLFDCVEDGKVQGFNDSVLNQLIKFLRFEPKDRGIDMRPYLSQPSPVNKKLFINHKGDQPLPPFKPGRWQYPRKALYF